MRPLRGQGRIVGGKKSKFGDWPWQVRALLPQLLLFVLFCFVLFHPLFLKGAGEGVHLARPVHQEQVRRCAHLRPTRPHCSALSAWVSLQTASLGREHASYFSKPCMLFLSLQPPPRFLASLLVEVGEYDISGPNEMMSTKEMKVSCLHTPSFPLLLFSSSHASKTMKLVLPSPGSCRCQCQGPGTWVLGSCSRETCAGECREAMWVLQPWCGAGGLAVYVVQRLVPPAGLPHLTN